MYDPDRKILDYTKMRATKIKSNPRVMMPESHPAREEAQLAARTSLIENTVRQYKGNVECIENLTPSERRGLKKLGKRVQNKKIVIWLTDESGKMCVSTLEEYEKAGDQHMMND